MRLAVLQYFSFLKILIKADYQMRWGRVSNLPLQNNRTHVDGFQRLEHYVVFN
jgi:hypothetical protein